MILLTGNGYSFCGLASGIGVSEDTAFAVASETCATGYYSFGHEIGHLFGARHIITQDPTPTPFSYGHGYCNTTASTWRNGARCCSQRAGCRHGGSQHRRPWHAFQCSQRHTLESWLLCCWLHRPSRSRLCRARGLPTRLAELRARRQRPLPLCAARPSHPCVPTGCFARCW